MSNNEPVADALILGAGLSGLMAAQALRQQGLHPLLVDKGRSVGGRLATRRIGPGRADHGAQFFTVRTPEFEAWVDDWQREGLVFRWSSGWSDGSLATAPADGHPRYAVRGGMNALAKHLARDLDVRTDTRITALLPAAEGWQATDDKGASYRGRSLLLTSPVPQSLALLDAGAVHLAPEDRAALERIEYAPCLAGLFWLDRSPALPEPGALQRVGETIPWMADNQRKGISPEAVLVTVHAGTEASRRLYEAPVARVLAFLQAGLEPYLLPGTAFLDRQVKRWRFAQPVVLHGERTLLAAGLPPLAFAGDAFGAPRLEGAALSGLAAAHTLILARQGPA